MISGWLSTALTRRNIHYGWAMIAVTFVTALVSAAAVGAPGVFIVPLQKEFGWSTAEISSAMSIRFVLFGLMAPFAAALMNRYGLRNVTLIALLVVAASLILSLGMTQVWQLMALWGVAVGIGTGMTALVLGATVAARWFSARRGLVVGILTASAATGQLIFLPILASITEHSNWRWALALMCVMLAIAALGVLLVMRDRPSDIGIRPYGDTSTEPLAVPPPNTSPIMAAALGALRDAAQTKVFWILFATFFICGASTNGLVQVHLIPMCLDFGIPQIQAAGLLAAMGVFDFVGTIASGWLSDRYDNRYLLFWYYGLRDGFIGSHQRKQDEAIHLLLILARRRLVRIETAFRIVRDVGHLTPDLGGEISGHGLRQQAEAGLAREQPRPVDFDAATKRRHRSHPRNYNAAHDVFRSDMSGERPESRGSGDRDLLVF